MNAKLDRFAHLTITDLELIARARGVALLERSQSERVDPREHVMITVKEPGYAERIRAQRIESARVRRRFAESEASRRFIRQGTPRS